MSQLYPGRPTGRFALAGRFGIRFLLRLGCAALLTTMVAALIDSYRIQHNIARAPTPNKVDPLQKEAALGLIRRRLTQAQSLAMDHLFGSGPDRTADYVGKLRTLKRDLQPAMDKLEELGTSRDLLAQLRTGIQTYWDTLEKFGKPDEMRLKRGYEFTQKEIQFGRRPINEILRAISEESRNGQEKFLADLEGRRRAEHGRLLILVAAATVLTLAVVAVTLTWTRQLEQESFRELEEVGRAKIEMQRLSARLLNVQEEESRRLSRELHDGIGQTLTALQIEIAHCQLQQGSTESNGREGLQRARLLSEEAVRVIRDISLLLRPSTLDDLGLTAALHWQVEDFQRRTGIPCTFSVTGLQEHLPDPRRTCIYRVVQEAMHNCQKHAAPSQIQIRIHQGSKLLIVEVVDDGVGFELNAKGAPLHGAGLGILGMRERAAMLGGTVTIDSALGHGTKLSLKLPLASIATPENDTMSTQASDIPASEV